jgi:hypothetical protein
MRTNMRLILAAMGVAVLASPVTAQTGQNARVPLSTDLVTKNVFRGTIYGRPYGYIAHPPVGRLAPGAIIEGTQPRILDCVHVLFPQCSDGG